MAIPLSGLWRPCGRRQLLWFCSIASLRWRSAFSWMAHVFKHGRSAAWTTVNFSCC
ncbi:MULTISPECIES: DUF1010 domain-containing protein [unclassified Acidovorax]|uniref:DUF1010 domain-containing protein n=1 Tax=Acidovorax sp. CF316 TaxID=1144317 RepID=UPI0012F93869